MPAYQPIQLHIPDFAEGFRDIPDFQLRVAQARKAEEERRAALVREGMIRAAQAKTPEEREAIIKGYGGAVTNSQDVYGDTVKYKVTGGDVSGKFLDELQGMYNDPSLFPQGPAQNQPQPPRPMSAPAQPTGITGGSQADIKSVPFGGYDSDNIDVQTAPQNPIIAARKAEDARRADVIKQALGMNTAPHNQDIALSSGEGQIPGRLLGKRMEYTLGGQNFVNDPREQYLADKAKRDEFITNLDKNFESSDDEISKSVYSQLRPFLVNGTLDVNDAVKAIGQEKSLIAAENRDAARKESEDRRFQAKLDAQQNAREEWDRRIGILEAGRNYRAGMTPTIKANKEQASTINVSNQYWEAADKVWKDLGGAANWKDQSKVNEMLSNITGATDNAALASLVAGSFTKYAQGGTGVISDADLKYFWQKIGGLGLRAEQLLADYSSGNLAPDKKRILADAMKGLVSASQRTEARIGTAVENRLHAMPGGDAYIEQYLKTKTPSYYQTWVKNQGGVRGGGAPGAKLSNEEINSYLDWLIKSGR